MSEQPSLSLFAATLQSSSWMMSKLAGIIYNFKHLPHLKEYKLQNPQNFISTLSCHLFIILHTFKNFKFSHSIIPLMKLQLNQNKIFNLTNVLRKIIVMANPYKLLNDSLHI